MTFYTRKLVFKRRIYSLFKKGWLATKIKATWKFNMNGIWSLDAKIMPLYIYMYVFLESYTYLNKLDSSVYKLYNNLLSFFMQEEKSTGKWIVQNCLLLINQVVSCPYPAYFKFVEKYWNSKGLIPIIKGICIYDMGLLKICFLYYDWICFHLIEGNTRHILLN